MNSNFPASDKSLAKGTELQEEVSNHGLVVWGSQTMMRKPRSQAYRRSANTTGAGFDPGFVQEKSSKLNLLHCGLFPSFQFI
jgi:hypothetical protein